MKKIFIFPVAAAVFICGCGTFVLPDKIPLGKWNYRLLLNGVEAGTAEITSMKAGDNYQSTSEMRITLAGMTSISKETVVETADFRPVSFQSYSKTGSGNSINETFTSAVFNGTKVDLSINNKKTSYDIKKDFIIEGNYTISKLIEGRFRDGLEVEEIIYNPSIELDNTIPVKTRVIGIEDIDINGKTERLIHVAQTIENIKGVDIYLDSAGVTKKAVIKMLNVKMEIIKIN
ncbi:MAG: hypothetical protein MUC95_08495 [Spirochaetes bacterium]|jgi:hypothetical protein|nr:hypothetical protein [Spirochaetota bacterium]